MSAVISALYSTAITVRDWALTCYEVAANFCKSIWEGFANFMCNLVDFIKEQFSKLRFLFCYSNQTTNASTSTSEDGRTQVVEVNQRKIQVEVRYNHDDETEPDEIQVEKMKNLEIMRELKNAVNQTFELMEADVRAYGNPTDQAKTTEKVRQYMDGANVKNLIDKMDSAPSTLA